MFRAVLAEFQLQWHLLLVLAPFTHKPGHPLHPVSPAQSTTHPSTLPVAQDLVSDCEAIPRQRETRLIQQTACAAHTAIPPSSPTEEAGRQMEVLHRPDSTPKLSKETLTQLTLGC